MNKQLDIQDMLELKIHDTIKIENGIQAVRVPSGWIYYLQTNVGTTPAETFVPEPIQRDYDQKYLKKENKLSNTFFVIIFSIVFTGLLLLAITSLF